MPRRPSRAAIAARSSIHSYALPPLPEHTRRHDYQLRSHYGPPGYAPHFESLAEQLEQASLDQQQRRSMYFSGGTDYQSVMQASFTSPPPVYSSELFMPSVQGAPTVVSDSDDNEAMTPEPGFAAMEPTVLVSGDHHSATPGPTSNPYGNSPAGYYNGQPGSVPRYTMNDIAGVADEQQQLSCCDWNSSQQRRQ
jgi:hypothetical protein